MEKQPMKSTTRLILGLTVAVLVFVLGMTITFVVADHSGKGTGTGTSGKSAYEIAVENGFTGTEQEWLASLTSQWLTGEGAPDETTAHGAKTGDFYCDTRDNVVYRKTETGWERITPEEEKNTVSVWDGTVRGWTKSEMTEEEMRAARPASYVVDEQAKTVEIADAQAFAWFAFRSVVGKQSFAGYTVRLQCDIDLDNNEWIPIGLAARAEDAGVPFEGTFDGNGHVISNVRSENYLQNVSYENNAYMLKVANGMEGTARVEEKIPFPAAMGDAIDEFVYGLFAVTRNAVIRNLTVQNVAFTFAESTAVGERTLVTDCAGGLVGFASGDLTVENCTVGSAEHGEATDFIKNANCAGGIAGRIYAGYGKKGTGNGSDVSSYGTILLKNCTNYLDIDTPNDKAGGITAYPHYFRRMQVIGCENYGNIKGEQASGIVANEQGIGGIEQVFEITDCVNYGSITGPYAAGIVARRYAGYAGEKGYFAFVRCVNYGKIYATRQASNYSYSGGLFGYVQVNLAYGEMTDCVNYGDIEYLADAEQSEVDLELGGICGFLDFSYITEQASVLVRVENHGNITYATGNGVKDDFVHSAFGNHSALEKPQFRCYSLVDTGKVNGADKKNTVTAA